MKIKTAQRVRDMLFVLGFVVMLCGVFYRPLLAVGAVAGFAGLVPHFLFNRCPRCEKNLGRNTKEFCQYCGARIDEEASAKQ